MATIIGLGYTRLTSYSGDDAAAPSYPTLHINGLALTAADCDGSKPVEYRRGFPIPKSDQTPVAIQMGETVFSQTAELLQHDAIKHIQHYETAANNAIQTLAHVNADSIQTARTCINQIAARYLAQVNSNTENSGEALKQCRQALINLLQGLCKQQKRFHWFNPAPTYTSTTQLFKQHLSEVLNNQPWSRLNERHSFNGSQFEIQRIPAINIAPLTKKFQQAKITGGISSGSPATLKKQFAPNLWQTQLTTASAKDQAPLFKGIRHGAITSDAGAKDLLRAAIDAKYADIIKFFTQNPTTSTFELKLASTSLMTPSKVFWQDTLEKRLLKQQWQALDALNLSTHRLNITLANGDKKSVYIKPRILTFNFGVNGIAKNPIIQKLNRLLDKIDILSAMDISSWAFADKRNPQNLKTLMQWSQDFVNDCQDPETIKRIYSLRERIHSLQNHQRYRKEDNNAYELPVLITLLSHEVGVQTAFNCKSGKDRTAIMEAYLYLTAMNLYQPKGSLMDFAEPLSQQAQRTLFNLHTQGNAEIQRLNTGQRGNKVFWNQHPLLIVKSVVGPFVENERARIRGGANLVKS